MRSSLKEKKSDLKVKIFSKHLSKVLILIVITC